MIPFALLGHIEPNEARKIANCRGYCLKQTSAFRKAVVRSIDSKREQ
jgi:hypothetical protein